MQMPHLYGNKVFLANRNCISLVQVDCILQDMKKD